MNRLLLIVCTAFPGIQKLIVLLLLSHLYGAETVGIYSSDFGVATFFSFVTAAGYAAVLLKNIPASTVSNKNILLSSRLLSCFILSIMIIPAILAMNEKGWVYDFYGVTFCLITIGPYQIVRNFFFAEGRYCYLLMLDVLYLFIQLVVIALSSKENFFSYSGLAAMFFLFFLFFLLRIKLVFSKKALLEVDAIQFAGNNIVGAGVSAMTPLVLLRYYHAEVVGLISTYLALVSFFIVLIRSFSNFLIPVLVQRLKVSGRMSVGELKDLRVKFYFVYICAVLLALIGFYPIKEVMLLMNYRDSMIDVWLYIGVVLFLFCGSISIFNGNVLFVLSKQKYNLYSNVIYAILFVIFNLIVINSGAMIEPPFLLLFFAAISVIRYPYLSFYLTKYVR